MFSVAIIGFECMDTSVCQQFYFCSVGVMLVCAGSDGVTVPKWCFCIY